ncbi:hypothetical protein LOD99_15871 [Oopsacas minuta]|uniref:Uncharacterized protein n=1 Tax=Oopsacas minuta TaxID=111878 RepID=A0AAV7K8U5_9METZ|nr:hypothetical protein LOD99_15871 [Oopsacas minuta]
MNSLNKLIPECASGVDLEWESLRFDQDLVIYSFKHHLSVFRRFLDEFNISDSELTRTFVEGFNKLQREVLNRNIYDIHKLSSETFKVDSRSSKVGKRYIEIIGCMAVNSSIAERGFSQLARLVFQHTTDIEKIEDQFDGDYSERNGEVAEDSDDWSSEDEDSDIESEMEILDEGGHLSFDIGIKTTPFSVHFGRTPPDLSVDMLLPREVLNTLDDEDQLEQPLATRQVTKYVEIPQTPPLPPSPMLLTRLSLQEPTVEIDISASATLTDTVLPQPCSSHDISTNPSFTPSEEQEDMPADDTGTNHPLTS